MRVSGYGNIDRDRPINFTFDGVNYQGFHGDTLASALLANGVRLMARSFKYHRPRGPLTAGSEEPNALVRVAGTPNLRATTVPLHDGLKAESQNRWPSLKRDVMSVNDLISPFLGAGFYYKTFMWPKSFWESIYEPIIRRAAGLGALTGAPSDKTYEKAFAFCEVLVIGGGPAGLMAALTAGRAGRDVILADENAVFGGRLLSEAEEIDGGPASDWVSKTVAELDAMANVRLMPNTTVTGAYDQGTYAALEVVGHEVADCFWRIAADHAILCAGALERPIAFPDNDRPGILLASALRSYLHRWGVVPGKAITIFANNDDGHRTARDLHAAGATIAGVIDSRADAPESADWKVYRRGRVVGTKGRLGLEEVTIEHDGGTRQLRTDCLGVSGGWNPTVHLACHMNGRPEWQEDIQSFVPVPGMIPGLVTAGACQGTFDTSGCLADGARAAADVLGVDPVRLPQADSNAYRIEALWAVEGRGRKWIDFQNDVHVKDVRLAAQENFRSVEHMKRYTTQGMATDQGKSSNVAALAVLADATGRGIPETGTTTFRPPYVPVAIAAMGAGGAGKGFSPERFTTSHDATVARHAPMVEAGLWYRPSYFPAPGETTWQESCNREVRMVRETVGICDVSTLGKIDIQGPDAPAFLDFVYTNSFSTLTPGRVRYGLMLREDGTVMDDGTSARLAEGHYLMTTTTAAAGTVMSHLEFVRQGLCSDLDVHINSVTDHWAQFAVAGPRSRELLNTLLDQPIDDAAWPFMSCGSITISGVEGRLFRISFSGEHAYEIAVPARYGAALFNILCAQAETMGGGPYGMEALNVLRIEKGHITHAEIHGRTTAYDVGFERMISRKKDCIGQTMAARPGLVATDRERLIGLKPVEADGRLTAGAHLFNTDARPIRTNNQGYVTSVAYSPTLGHHIGLGFLKSGPERQGEQIDMIDHLRGLTTRCEVCSPVFVDPDGGRLRG